MVMDKKWLELIGVMMEVITKWRRKTVILIMMISITDPGLSICLQENIKMTNLTIFNFCNFLIFVFFKK